MIKLLTKVFTSMSTSIGISVYSIECSSKSSLDQRTITTHILSINRVQFCIPFKLVVDMIKMICYIGTNIYMWRTK